MNARIGSEPRPVKNRTTVERTSDREVVVTRTINGRARIVFEAFTKAELLKRWWVPKSMGMTLPVLRGGCSCRRQVPIGIRCSPRACGVFRHVCRSEAAHAPRVDQ